MLCHKGGDKEESFGKGRLKTANCLPVGGAEVGYENKANLKEQVVSEYARECTGDIWMMLNLAKTWLDVIGMNNNVIVGVQNP